MSTLTKLTKDDYSKIMSSVIKEKMGEDIDPKNIKISLPEECDLADEEDHPICALTVPEELMFEITHPDDDSIEIMYSADGSGSGPHETYTPEQVAEMLK